MRTIRSINLQKNLGDVLRTADVEAVVLMNREQPRAVVMSAEEFIRLKVAAGEQVPAEVRKSRPTVHQRLADPLGYDTRDPSHIAALVGDALAGLHQDDIRSEVHGALRRWGMRL